MGKYRGPPPTPILGRCKKRKKQNTDCGGETWVAGKAEPTSPRVAASLGEPMLGCNIGWTRRGVPIWEVNRSDGTMAPATMVRWYDGFQLFESGPMTKGGQHRMDQKRGAFLGDKGQMVQWHHPGEIRTYYHGWP